MKLRRSLFLLILIAFSFQFTVAIQAQQISGTFLQLYNDHNDWPIEKWQKLFGHLETMQVDRIVLQWMLYAPVTKYPAEEMDLSEIKQPVLQTLLRLAEEHTMQVSVGLVYDPNYWEKIKRDPMLVEVYLKRLLLVSKVIVETLIEDVKDHPSFEGWYISEEIDDENWTMPAHREVLYAHLGELSEMLQEKTPGKSIAISGFSNANFDPDSLSAFWEKLLKRNTITEVMFQDGIGAEKLTLDYLSLYIDAMSRVTTELNRELTPIVELFEVKESPEIEDSQADTDEDSFSAQPASLDRIERQIEIASRFLSRTEPMRIMAFSIPEYMTPLGGDAAEKLYIDYLDRMFKN